ncbi:hypothetical protein [Pseudomonas bananamidigenes]|uniref:hypothetical protein n=1 Tax=Pseudomonas bananamidigenes TaxID=2843610 RepID=UPI0011478744|nr:hypothetical protein [Pseudomonas bananamidigenes]
MDFMKRECDLYLCDDVEASQLKVIRLFDKSFVCENGKRYSGYLRVNVNRVKLVSVVSDLRQRKILCFSVPVEYRASVVSHKAALEIAKKYIGESGVIGIEDQAKKPPLVWSFSLAVIGSEEEKTDGVVMVDRLDGHVWSIDEYEQYMYDYNNVF